MRKRLANTFHGSLWTIQDFYIPNLCSQKFNYIEHLNLILMKPKILLFSGIFLLVVGILLRKLTQLDVVGLSLIIIGVAFKTIYIIIKAKRGEYQPGKELIFLALGLILFFTGLNLRGAEDPFIRPVYLIVLGITLKVVFVVRFIQISRSQRLTRNS